MQRPFCNNHSDSALIVSILNINNMKVIFFLLSILLNIGIISCEKQEPICPEGAEQLNSSTSLLSEEKVIVYLETFLIQS